MAAMLGANQTQAGLGQRLVSFSRKLARRRCAPRATKGSVSRDNSSRMSLGTFALKAILCRTADSGSRASRPKTSGLSFRFSATHHLTVESSSRASSSRISRGTVLLCATHFRYSGYLATTSRHTSNEALPLAASPYSAGFSLERRRTNSCAEGIVNKHR